MAKTSMWCPKCGRPLYFEDTQIGSQQYCQYCGQAVIVADAVVSASGAALPAMMVSNAPARAGGQGGHQGYAEERSIEHRTARKINMASGCFAMLAVMFAIWIMFAGLGAIMEATPRKLYAYSSLAAGLGGLLAFIFFGYIATERASSEAQRGKDQR
jgi:DNA-directed RNA polymerase subunit RPC12/RpoP